MNRLGNLILRLFSVITMFFIPNIVCAQSSNLPPELKVLNPQYMVRPTLESTIMDEYTKNNEQPKTSGTVKANAPPASGTPTAGSDLTSEIIVRAIAPLNPDDHKNLKRVKDPFMVPNHLYIKIKKTMGDAQGEGFVDENAPIKTRWSLKHYKLVGLIWSVKEPKAIFSVDNDKNRLHTYVINERIANNGGVIKEIKNGSVIVRDNENEAIIKIAKILK